MKKKTRIYGAYGSNMNLAQMGLRCPNARVIGTGTLKNYKLTFRGIEKGVANIEKMKGGSVPIILWEITAKCEKALDIYEAYPRLYEKSDVKVITDEGTVTAMVYVMAKEYERLPAKPSSHYLDTIRQGYIDNNIALLELKQAVADNKNEIFKRVHK